MNINEIDLHHLRCVAALAEELNFGRAAERLHMSQPPLTRLIADVEKAAGARLFARTTRRVALTEVGEVFAAEACTVLAQMEEAMQHVAAARDRQAGLLRLAYTPAALQSVLPRLLSRFREHDHDARIDLIEMPAAAQRDALRAGQVDLAFCGEIIDTEGIESVRLSAEPLALLVPDGHPLAGEKLVQMNALRGETLILHPRQEYPNYYDRVVTVCAASGPGVNIRERETGQNCLALVISGGGLLLVPAWGQPPPGLRRVEIETNMLLCAEIWAAWRKDTPAGRARTLTEIAEAEAKLYFGS